MLYVNFDPLSCQDGVQAMQKLNNQTFDLIIVDLVMPKRWI